MIQNGFEKGVLTLSINRPDKKNALTADMYLQLAEQIKAAQTNNKVKVILIRGEGADFCAGNDLNDFLAVAQVAVQSDDLSAFPPMTLLHALVDNQVPMVAAVQGAAIGIGFTLMLHCDLVICANNVRLQAPFVDLGLVPEAGSSLLLPERVGRAVAAEILLLGAPLSAERAYQLQLCNRVCDPSELDSLALQIALNLAKKPSDALRISRRLLQPEVAELHARIDEEAHEFLQRLQSDEARQALSRFFQR